MTEPIPSAESARALLWRHNLPEDVIDGALALFAQELAGKIRAWHDRLPGEHECCDGNAADLISPENWARPVPAVVSAAALSTDQAAPELASLAVNAANALRDEKRHYEIACEEIARLRATINRVRQLHDALDAEDELTSPDGEITRGRAARKIAAALDGWTDPAELRRLAGEARATNTQADEAHPPTSTWKVESPRRDKWASWGATYDERVWAAASFEDVVEVAPQRPFRLVRATTTYTVEAEHQPTPATPEPAEAAGTETDGAQQ